MKIFYQLYFNRRLFLLFHTCLSTTSLLLCCIYLAEVSKMVVTDQQGFSKKRTKKMFFYAQNLSNCSKPTNFPSSYFVTNFNKGLNEIHNYRRQQAQEQHHTKPQLPTLRHNRDSIRSTASYNSFLILQTAKGLMNIKEIVLSLSRITVITKRIRNQCTFNYSQP